ncbi:MAG: pilus assembly protein [Porphyrobacter sp.]|nr:pilus assembly protein [Porphyrobacter sp.]
MRRSLCRFTRALVSDERGATIVEFAFILPVFAGLLMFLFDTGYFLYARSILAGEVNAAARASTLETATAANVAAVDAGVTEQVHRLVPHGNLSFERRAFKSYALASGLEPFKDIDGDGECNHGEPFVDGNNNLVRDRDTGTAGTGGAKDAVVYTATLTYDRLFPVAGLLGWDQVATVTASAIMRNQPFANQAEPAIRTCP